MAKDYAASATRALASITRSGTDVTITREVAASFDPTTGQTTPGADIVATGKGVQTRYSNRDIDGTVIKRGDMRLDVAASGLSVEPEQNDSVEIDSVDWIVVNVELIKPATVPVLYICQVRK